MVKNMPSSSIFILACVILGREHIVLGMEGMENSLLFRKEK